MQALPNELATRVAMLLSWRDLSKISMTCHSLHNVVKSDYFLREWQKEHLFPVFRGYKGDFFRWCYSVERTVALLEKSLGPIGYTPLWNTVLECHKPTLLYSACLMDNADLALAMFHQIPAESKPKSNLDPLVRLLIEQRRFEDLRAITTCVDIHHSPWNMDEVPVEYRACFKDYSPKEDRSDRWVSIRTSLVEIHLPFEYCDANGVGPARPKPSAASSPKINAKLVAPNGMTTPIGTWVALMLLGCYGEEDIPEDLECTYPGGLRSSLGFMEALLRERNVELYENIAVSGEIVEW